MKKRHTRGQTEERRRVIVDVLERAGEAGMRTAAVAEALDASHESVRHHLRTMAAQHEIKGKLVARKFTWFAPSISNPRQPDEPEVDDAPLRQVHVAANDWRIDHPTSPASVFDLGPHINRSAA